MYDKPQIQESLEPYHQSIAKIIDLAWRESRAVRRLRAEFGYSPYLYKRTGTNGVFDAVARYALAEFGPDPRVHVRAESQTVKFFIGGGILARFKQGNAKKLSSNIPTLAALGFVDPEYLPYADLPPETAKLDFVWLPNVLRTDYEGIFVVARDGKKVLWDYPIPRYAGDESNVEVFPGQPDHDNDSYEGIVTPKRRETDAEDKE